MSELDVPVAPGAGGAPEAPAPGGRWALDQVRADAAWAALRRAGREPGREAEGVRLALVDTGYLEHPEITGGAAPPLRRDAGRDDVDGDADARDEGTGRGDASGHGTASASVLASPPGCQLDGQPDCIDGLAPGAAVAPVRAQRAPSHHHAGRLARILHDVAAGALPAPVDGVVVAVAGPPGWALWQAAARAERSGRLVVAAAGSAGGPVLWPARFDSTIAVAATGPACDPWPRASRGPAVDVWAPGAFVWHAALGPDGAPRNAPGSSAGFAASLVGGAAALWLARFADEPALEALRATGGQTAAFRRALARSAWQPTRPPRGVACPGRAGGRLDPGVLDAAALLAEAPSTPGAAPSPLVGLGELPLFRSVLPPGSEAQAPARYRALFGLAPGRPLEAVAWLEAEVLHHYAMDAEVAATLDAVVAGEPSPEALAAARRALRRQGLSGELREALQAADAPD